MKKEQTGKTHAYYKLKAEFDEKIHSFFDSLFEFRLKIETRVLEEEDYNKIFAMDSGAELHTSVIKGKPNAQNLLERYDTVSRRIYIRKYGEGVELESIVHEFLHAYYPYVSESRIEQATPIFSLAFLVYDRLVEQREQEFFIQLCRDNERLCRWAGLKMAKLSDKYRYDKELKAEARENEEQL